MTGIFLYARTDDLITVHSVLIVIRRAERVRGRKQTTVLLATAELICPTVNVLTARPMPYATDRLIFPALRAISNQTANVSKMNPNQQRQTRSTLVRHA